MKASDCIVQFLESLGVKYVFGYQGGMITHIVDSLSRSDKIKYIQCYHEQTAAIVAEGYAMESGKLGVAISTSGPGATNMLTGIADAYFGSVPVLYITGQVNTYEYKYNKRIRQLGFQETDIVSIVKPVTKYATMVNSAENLESELKKAVGIAFSNRKGAVLLDLPMDVQRSEIKNFDSSFVFPSVEIFIDSEALKNAEVVLRNAKRPFVICGNGIFQSKAQSLVKHFLEKTNIPYAVSMLGKGCVREDSELFCGMIGSYGNRSANIIFSQADIVLSLGARLDVRQTGNINSEQLKKIKFIHIDIDKDELSGSNLPNRIDVHCSLSDFIESFCTDEFFVLKEWLSYCKSIKLKYSQKKEVLHTKNQAAPYNAITAIRNSILKEATFVSDVGQNQVWTAQSLHLNENDRLYSSGGLAPMGFAIPCAVGAAFANPGRKIVCITGDGGFHFALQSLQLISQYHLNITIYVLNNASLGMITQFQALYFDSNMAGTTRQGGYVVPNVEKIAEAYSLRYERVSSISGPKTFGSESCTIYEIVLPELTTVIPKLEYNKELYDMLPYLSADEINDIKIIDRGGVTCKIYTLGKIFWASSFAEAA